MDKHSRETDVVNRIPKLSSILAYRKWSKGSSPKSFVLIGRDLLNVLCFLFLAALFTNCAQPGTLTGGPKDTQPPRIDSLKSTPNLSTNFTEKELRITFDEWIRLDDVFNQVVISPPQNEKPEIKLKGKTVILTLNDSLIANTTYSIFFGEAVKDITENNPARNLKYVFSTGDYIDSLEMSGTVLDAVSGQPLEDFLVMLYRSKEDSVVFKEKPIYFAKTSKNGSFKISNIGGDSYKVFGIKDENFNYLYDLENELIAYPSEDVVITDSTITKLKLFAFDEVGKFSRLAVDKKNYGKIKIGFNAPPRKVQVKPLNAAKDLVYQQEVVNDSLFFWYDLPKGDSLSLVLENGTEIMDTLGLKLPSRSGFLAKRNTIKPQSKSAAKPATVGKKGRNNISPQQGSEKTVAIEPLALHPDKPVKLEFNYPLRLLAPEKIVLVDSLGKEQKVNAKIDSASIRTLVIRGQWKEGKSYQIIFPPKVLSSIFPAYNDSIFVPLEIKTKEDFGSIVSTVEGLSDSSAYLIQLLDPFDFVLEEDRVFGKETFERSYFNLNPTIYRIRVIEDSNNNGRWDAGDYAQKRLPERITLHKLPPVKENWETEGKVIFGTEAPKIENDKGLIPDK